MSDAAPGFERLAGSVTGILFTNSISEPRSLANRNLLGGSGVAAGDVDGDGLCDLYLCGLDSENALYRNLGNWRFEDVTAQSGVACPGLDSTGATFADIDADGDLDLLVAVLGDGVKAFENNGHGIFTDITRRAGLTAKSGSTSIALGDVDGNGTLDLYVANYRPTTIADEASTRFRVQMVDGVPHVALVNGQPATLPQYTNRFVLAPSGRVVELGEPDVLYLNDGSGRFTVVSFTGGSFLNEEGAPLTDPPRDWSLAVRMHDLNGDLAPDIYVCSDYFTPDRIWINDGRGRFRALAPLALRNTSTFSMGVDFADIDRDGFFDFFVTDMLSRDHTLRHLQVAETSPTHNPVGVIDNRPQISRNTLHLNRGDGTFAEIGCYAGVEASEWSWGPIFLDVDLDGYEDLLVPNGEWGDFQNADVAHQIEEVRARKRVGVREFLELKKLYPRLETENLLFRNRGDCTFEEVGARWGFNTRGISQGMCVADLDNDGDLDVLINNLNSEVGVYRNTGGAPRIAVRLKGRPPNTQATGSKIVLRGGAVPIQIQEVICGGRYLSGDDPMRVFAVGTGSNAMTIEVEWRSGRRSLIEGVQPNRLYVIEEPGAGGAVGNPQPSEPVDSTRGGVGTGSRGVRPLFEDVGRLIGHTHTDEPFEDFVRQPLLPHRLSQGGPGLTWADVNGDGAEDLLIGASRGGTPGCYLNDGGGGFKRAREEIWARRVTRDQTAVLAWGPGGVLAGSSNYEDGLSTGGAVRLYDPQAGTITDVMEAEESSAGPIAMADVDGDGDLDLFVGGRVIPGRYPEPATSRLFGNENGKFELLQKFERVGLVNAAMFSDLDGDGRPELVVACEWGPIRVYRMEDRHYVERTAELGFAPYKGLWAGVSAGDLDGDGRLDVVAGNWGRNSKRRANLEHPLKLYYGDWDGNRSLDIIATYYDTGMGKEVPERGLRWVWAAMPILQERWRSFEAYGRAGALEIYGERLKELEVVEACVLTSTAFMNRGAHFEPVPLPREAQFAPALGVTICDADGDGNEDIFLSQNFFAVDLESARSDAGRGLWLKGDGNGAWTALSGSETGVAVYGEQRGCAAADYDRDGRIDLAVAQNGNATKLYHNVSAKPGLRVRLKGSPGNPWGIGAAIRLVYGGKAGPVREIRAGSGYWSQDGAVQVLGKSAEPSEIWVRWPGGRTTVGSVPAGALEIEVDLDGRVELIRSAL